MRIADQIAVMEKGTIIQFGDPEEIYRTPATRSVAEAIGAEPINWLSRPLISTFDARSGDVGVRPEDLRTSPNGLSRPIEFQGSLLRKSICGDGAISLVVRCSGLEINARVDDAGDIEANDTISLWAGIDSLHWFDTSTGLRMEG